MQNTRVVGRPIETKNRWRLHRERQSYRNVVVWLILLLLMMAVVVMMITLMMATLTIMLMMKLTFRCSVLGCSPGPPASSLRQNVSSCHSRFTPQHIHIYRHDGCTMYVCISSWILNELRPDERTPLITVQRVGQSISGRTKQPLHHGSFTVAPK